MSSSILERVPFAARALIRHGRAPLGVSWVITNRCNLHCVYCDCPTTPLDELTTDECLDVIDQMATLGTVRVHVTGGEPLMRKDLERLILRMRFHDMRVSLSSNGTLIPKRKRLLKSLRSVSLSLDGPPEVHDRHRADGQVAEVRAALETLREHGVTRYLTCLLASDTTTECIDFVLATGSEFGAEVYFQPALDVVLASERANPYSPEAERVRALLGAVIERKRLGAPVGNTLEGLTHLATWPAVKPLPCPVGRVAVRLTPDGVLLPCHERASTPDGESVRRGGFVDAFARLQSKRCTECWGAGRADLRAAVMRGPSGLYELFSA